MRNSIDAVSDRDFAIEFNSFASILMLHLSRFCEEIIFWMNPNNNFVAFLILLYRIFDHATKEKPDIPN